MNNHENFSKDDFIRLIMSTAESNSTSESVAKEYLTSKGLDTNSIISEGIQRIKQLEQQIFTKNRVSSNQTVKQTDKNTENALSPSFAWTHSSVVKLIMETGNSNPVDAIKTRARNLVLKAFESGWDGPPYDPIKLAKLINIDITPNDSVVDARTISITKNKFLIQYNPFQKPTRQNFSISHEIAHTLFSDCAEAIRYRETDPRENRQLEQLCNVAAAEIQLPYAIFSNDANQIPLSIEGLTQLATKYKSSLESVLIRYTEVIDKPCAILIGIFQSDTKITIDYSIVR